MRKSENELLQLFEDEGIVSVADEPEETPAPGEDLLVKEPEDDGTAEEPEGEELIASEQEEKKENTDPDDNTYDIKDDFMLRHGNETYSAKELIDAYKSREKWNKANTEKAQKIAKEREAIKNTALVSNARKEALSVIAGNQKIFDMVVAELAKAGSPDDAEKIKKALEIDESNVVNPYAEDLKRYQEAEERRKQEEKYLSIRKGFAEEYKLSEDIVTQVENACVKHFEETKTPMSLEHMYLKMKEKGIIKGKDAGTKTAGKAKLPPKVNSKQTWGNAPAKQKTYKRPSRSYGVPVEAMKGVVSPD